MRIIFIPGGHDFDALLFRNEFGENPNAKVWQEATSGIVKAKEGDIDVETFEFEDVDSEFIKFIKDEIIEYDDGKTRNFYIVNPL